MRKYFFIIVLFMCYLGLAVQLARIQMLEQKKYAALAKSQHYKRVEIPARRGAILDRNGRILAQTLQINSVYADATEVVDVGRASKELGKVLGIKPDKIRTTLNKEKKFVWLKRKVSPKEAQEVNELAINGVDVLPETMRSYPCGTLLSQVLGIVDIDGRGLEGVELSLDKELSGSHGYMVMRRDGLQRGIFTGETVLSTPQHGNNAVLTIDLTIQNILEEELDKACKEWRPESAIAIVMEARTGEILAMACRPTFDPNDYQTSSPEQRRNRVITDCYEPGSLIKPLILGGVLKRGLAKPTDVFYCNNGVFPIGKRVIRDVHPYKDLTVEGIIVNSSNIGMAKLAMLEGPNRLYSDLKEFGLGSLTGIEIPGEVSGVLRPTSKWTSLSLTSIAMGYEVTVTPLQILTAYCAIANGGTLVKPNILLALSDSQGMETKRFETQKVHRVVSVEVAKKINGILAKVVEEGTGRKAMLPEYSVAGKTGTAKKLNPSGRGYGGGYVSSFIGYVTGESPQLCALVMIDNPVGAYYGGTVSAPVVGAILRRSLNYLKTGVYCAMG